MLKLEKSQYLNSIFQFNYNIWDTEKTLWNKIFHYKKIYKFEMQNFVVISLMRAPIRAETFDSIWLNHFMDPKSNFSNNIPFYQYWGPIQGTLLLINKNKILKLHFLNKIQIQKKNVEIGNYLPKWGLQILIMTFFDRMYNLCFDFKKQYWE